MTCTQDHPVIGIEEPSVSIVCGGTWVYEAEFQYITVDKATVKSRGDVVGSYTGHEFTIPLEGIRYTGTDGKNYFDLPILQGGEGITWSYAFHRKWYKKPI